MFLVEKFKNLFVRRISVDIESGNNDKFHDYIKERASNGPKGYYSYSNPSQNINYVYVKN